jgi:aryl-alcohol dehydrogenase-like predicted oxidoreductase
MHYRQLGRSGLTVSVVGLGGNNFGGRLDLEGARAVVDAALDAGITLLDTADVYGNVGGSETLLGELLAGCRDQVVLATKFGAHTGGPPDEARGSRRYIRKAVEASLRRLQTDYIDLYQQHQPDPKSPLEETIATLNDLVREGKVRYGGSSNYAAWQVAEAEWITRTNHQARLISAQNQYSLLEREIEVELVPACLHYGIGILPYFPLARGLLTGKYKRGHPLPANTRLASRQDLFSDQLFDRLESLEKYAADRGRSMLEVAIGVLAAQPAVASVIAGAMTADQIRANAAAGDWQPTPDDLAALDAILPQSDRVIPPPERLGVSRGGRLPRL